MTNFFKKVVVTGGSGFLGKRLRTFNPEWIYVSTKDLDLFHKNKFYEFLKDVNAEAVVHLAAKTGGIKTNSENQSDFYYENSLISLNVLKQAKDAGIKRVLSSLSTCCYPDITDSYPMKEDQLLVGEPTDTNYGYALAKRELFKQTNFYRKFYNLNYSTFTPSNLYGPESNFDEQTSHFIASLIKKIYKAKENEEIFLLGTGLPMRQHLYVDDLAKIIPILLIKHNSDVPINVAPKENFTIKQISEIAIKEVGKNNIVNFNGQLDGQWRKDVDNAKLIELIGNFEFTSLNVGLKTTYDWYAENNK